MNYTITPRILAELAAHEGIVREAYLDSVGVWTWGIGVTNASGHEVHPRYKDRPQDMERVFEVYEWLVRERYLPGVKRAFKGRPLTEEQLGAALSFHYNTGGIERASWVKRWLEGDVAGARKSIMNWKKPASIIPRRRKERDLFFDGKWSGDGFATVYPVRKPSYTPNWREGKRTFIMDDIKRAMDVDDNDPVDTMPPKPKPPGNDDIPAPSTPPKGILGWFWNLFFGKRRVI